MKGAFGGVNVKRIWICLMLFFLLCGCTSRTETAPTEETVPAETTIPTATGVIHGTIEPEVIAMAEAPPPPTGVILEAEHSGEKEVRCDTAVVDYSYTEDGYVCVQYTGETDKRLKAQVKSPKTTYTYTLPAGEWTVFPLSDGDGNYQVAVYKNTGGTKYATVMTAKFPVTLHDEFAPFLRPNQYVNYTDAVNSVAKGAQLCAGLEHPLEKVAAVYDFVVSTLSYDYEKAETIKSGYLPVLDDVLAEEKGICFDYAALMTAMLRSQEVPCKLVVGYAGSTYHAWISVWTEENGWVDGAIFFDGQVWKRMDPTFASSGERSEEIMDFIENGNYTAKYLY